jgi:hypothetical protein
MLIDAAYILKNNYFKLFMITIVGDGPLKKHLQEKINFLELNSNFSFVIKI